MIQRLNPYGWVVETILLALLLGTLVSFGFYLVEQHYWPDTPVRVLDASQAIERGWPAEW